jgi:hypothetical protein
MNCDQVFDILTRGPFPTGHSSDAAVERHLGSCADCRRLADALRPALDLFRESIPADESHDLPGYWGDLVEHSSDYGPASGIAQLVRLPVALHQRIDQGRDWISQRSSHAVRFAAAIMVGVALGALLWSAGIPAWQSDSTGARVTTGGSPSSESPLGAKPRKVSIHSQALMSINFAPECFGIRVDRQNTDSPPVRRPGSELLAQAEYGHLQCCTRCHASGSHYGAPAAIASVARSCAACHEL